MPDRSNPGEGTGGKQVTNLSAGNGSWFSVGQCVKCEYEVTRVEAGVSDLVLAGESH